MTVTKAILLAFGKLGKYELTFKQIFEVIIPLFAKSMINI